MPRASELFSLRRLLRAGRWALSGIASAWREERAFRQECVAALFLIPAGFWLGENGVERALLVGGVLLVLIAELLNTGIEAAVDLSAPQRHPLAEKAKNAAAGAVLVAIVNAAVVWGAVLWG